MCSLGKNVSLIRIVFLLIFGRIHFVVEMERVHPLGYLVRPPVRFAVCRLSEDLLFIPIRPAGIRAKP